MCKTPEYSSKELDKAVRVLQINSSYRMTRTTSLLMILRRAQSWTEDAPMSSYASSSLFSSAACSQQLLMDMHMEIPPSCLRPLTMMVSDTCTHNIMLGNQCGGDKATDYPYLIWPDIDDISNGNTSVLSYTMCVKTCPGYLEKMSCYPNSIYKTCPTTTIYTTSLCNS